MTKIATEMVEAALAWYISFIKKPEYSDQANGQLEGFASMLGTFAKLSVNNSAVINDEKIAIFSNAFKEHAETYAKNKHRLTLDVDWAPEWPLSDFLRKAEIPNTFFPSKTMVHLDFEKRTVTTDWGGGQILYPKQKAA